MTTLDDLARAVWMTWYKTRWPWDWMELGQLWYGGTLARNWKTFVILS